MPGVRMWDLVHGIWYIDAFPLMFTLRTVELLLEQMKQKE